MKYLAVLSLLIASFGWGQVPKCSQVIAGVWQWSTSDAVAWNSKELCELAAFSAAQVTEVPIRTQTPFGGIQIQHWEQPSEYPTVGNFPCDAGYKLQRYSTGNMHTEAQLEDFGGWKDVDAGPHDGDYRCVRDDKQGEGPHPTIASPTDEFETGAACASEVCPQ